VLRTLRIKQLQFAEHWRESGWRSAVDLGLIKTEVSVPCMKDLHTLRPMKEDFSSGDPAFVEIDTPDDLDPAWRYPLASRALRARAFFDRGWSAFAVVKDDQVIGDVWVAAPGRSRVPYVHPHVDFFGFQLGDHGVYMFDMYVVPDERGKAISTSFLLCALHRLAGRGYHRAYGYFAADNVPALWVHRMLGYEERPRVTLKRYGLFESAEYEQA